MSDFGPIDEVARDLGWPADSLTITPINGGITNRNWRVDVAGTGQFVVRVYDDSTAILGIDRENERTAAILAAQSRVGPTVVATLPERGALVTEFVDGVHPDGLTISRLPQLAWVVEALRRFHAAPPHLSTFDVFTVARQYSAAAAARGFTPPADASALTNTVERIRTTCAAQPPASVACHNDLLPANIILDGDRVVFIDYEYAGMGDPFFDLGNLSANSGFDDEADYSLLECYRDGTVVPAAWARLKLMRVMSEVREGMWGVVQLAHSTLEHVDFRDYAALHLGHALEMAGDARFGEWLTAAAEAVE